MTAAPLASTAMVSTLRRVPVDIMDRVLCLWGANASRSMRSLQACSDQCGHLACAARHRSSGVGSPGCGGSNSKPNAGVAIGVVWSGGALLHRARSKVVLPVCSSPVIALRPGTICTTNPLNNRLHQIECVAVPLQVLGTGWIVARWSCAVFVGLGNVVAHVVTNVVVNVAGKKARQDGVRGRLCLRKA